MWEVVLEGVRWVGMGIGGIALILLYGIPIFFLFGIPSLLLVAMTLSGLFYAFLSARRRNYVLAVAALLFASTPLILFFIDKAYWAAEAAERRRTLANLQYGTSADHQRAVLIARGWMLPKEAADLLNRGPFLEVWVEVTPRESEKYEWIDNKSGCAQRGKPSAEAALQCVQRTPAWRPPPGVPNRTLELFIYERSTLLPRRPHRVNSNGPVLELRAITAAGSELIKYSEPDVTNMPVFPYLASWSGFVHDQPIFGRVDKVDFVLSAIK